MQAKQGKKVILLWRLLDEASQKKATKLAFQEEHSIEGSVDGGDAKQTKDGAIITEGSIEEEVPFTSTMAVDDPVAEMLDEAFYEREKLELWEVDMNSKTADGKYKAEYRQGRLNDLTRSAATDDTVVLEGTFKTEGTRQKGEVTLTAEQEEIVQYAFRNTDEYKEPTTPEEGA